MVRRRDGSAFYGRLLISERREIILSIDKFNEFLWIILLVRNFDVASSLRRDRGRPSPTPGVESWLTYVWVAVRGSPEFVRGQFAEFVEFNLLGEHVQRHRGRPPQSAAALVVVQNGVERRPVPVEEVLVAQRVEIPHPSARVAQQRVRELVQRPQLRLEPHTAHLESKTNENPLFQTRTTTRWHRCPVGRRVVEWT